VGGAAPEVEPNLYEMQRRENIDKNRSMLESLGLVGPNSISLKGGAKGGGGDSTAAAAAKRERQLKRIGKAPASSNPPRRSGRNTEVRSRTA
jgi:hypothetical protein